MEIFVVGVSLGRVPLPVFEELRKADFLEGAEAALRGIDGVHEVVRLATRRRVEFILGASGGASLVAGTLREAWRRLLSAARAQGLRDEEVHEASGEEAVRHLIRLAAGLESASERKEEGLGDLRDAFSAAVERKATGGILGPLFHRAFRAARRIRRECGPDSSPPPREERTQRAVTMVEREVADHRSWMRKRELTPSIVRLGKLLDLLDLADGGAIRSRDVRRDLLRGFVSVAGDASGEDETVSRLALFEEVLRRSALRPAPRRGSPRHHSRPEPTAAPRGFVSLVGAGPGDPGLLTLKGAQRLRDADVVYHDALAPDALLELCPRKARRIPVGKRRGSAMLRQEEIEKALIRDARAGLAVVRLKGGDPFVFGRGGEEALSLVRAGVPFEIVPGVPSGTAVPAIAGIPLTHRGLASSAAFVTAHDLGPGSAGKSARARLAHLARGAETLVLFMAGAELARVKEVLLEAGLPPNTPAALIENGTLPEEILALGTLEGLERPGEGRGSGPLLGIIGPTVSLSLRLRPGMETLPWAASLLQRGRSPNLERRVG